MSTPPRSRAAWWLSWLGWGSRLDASSSASSASPSPSSAVAMASCLLLACLSERLLVCESGYGYGWVELRSMHTTNKQVQRWSRWAVGRSSERSGVARRSSNQSRPPPHSSKEVPLGSIQSVDRSEASQGKQEERLPGGCCVAGQRGKKKQEGRRGRKSIISTHHHRLHTTHERCLCQLSNLKLPFMHGMESGSSVILAGRPMRRGGGGWRAWWQHGTRGARPPRHVNKRSIEIERAPRHPDTPQPNPPDGHKCAHTHSTGPRPPRA